ncbi:transketolase [Micromonospora chalcea]|nr:transketolase [Micromonospora chalcea]
MSSTMRDAFVTSTEEVLADPRTTVVLADISAAAFEPAAARYPDRVINVGIREQLMVGVAGGLALTGQRPIVHSYAPFLVERAYEQIKLDLDHQGVGAVLVGIGGSYDRAEAGRTHLGPADVALIDTLHGWTVHVPGHPDEVRPLLRDVVCGQDSAYLRLSIRANARAYPEAGDLRVVRDAGPGAALLVAVGPVLATLPLLGRRVPRDVSVVAICPDELAEQSALTCVPVPAEEVGRQAVALLMRRLSGEGVPEVTLLEPHLTVRDTSARR